MECKLQLELSRIRYRIDGLTKVLNRTAFDVDIKEFVQITTREGFKGVILVIVLMNWKTVNDNRERNPGDHMLTQFVLALKTVSKKMSFLSSKPWKVYRIGEDKFAVIALLNSSDRQIFNSAAKAISEIRVPQANLSPEKMSAGVSYARVSGIFGAHLKHEYLEMIEIGLWKKKPFSTSGVFPRADTEIPMLYYLDEEDQYAVIKERELEMALAMKKREFERCALIQEYIHFLREGFEQLKKEWERSSKHFREMSLFSQCGMNLTTI